MSGPTIHAGLTVLARDPLDLAKGRSPGKAEGHVRRGLTIVGEIGKSSKSTRDVKNQKSKRRFPSPSPPPPPPVAAVLSQPQPSSSLGPLPVDRVRRARVRTWALGVTGVLLSVAFLGVAASVGGAIAVALVLLFLANGALIGLGCVITHRILMTSIRYRAGRIGETVDRRLEDIERISEGRYRSLSLSFSLLRDELRGG